MTSTEPTPEPVDEDSTDTTRDEDATPETEATAVPRRIEVGVYLHDR
ncbi:hypothetical protein [Nocardia sp. NPDC050793]